MSGHSGEVDSGAVWRYPFEVAPTAPDVAPGIGGAIVVAFVQRGEAGEAKPAAERLITEAGWLIIRREGLSRVSRNDFRDGDVELERYEQCLLDGEVAILHTYPLDDAPQPGDAE